MAESEFLRSTLRLFLSVDIVGSTAFKQGRAAAHKAEKPSEPVTPPAESWFSPIVQFYREIERLFAKEWQFYCQNIAKKQQWPTGSSPEFWKGAGDELIYTKELSDHREALACLQAWMKGVNAYRGAFRKSYPSLDLKSAAWLAGFPVHNAEVIFQSTVSDQQVPTGDDDPIYSNLALLKKFHDGTDKNLVRDFIGPSMDTGFRLASLATPRKLVVGLDLALMLVHAARTQQADFGYEQISFHYDGRVALKGVAGGAPYPVFWVDMAAADALNKAEDRLARAEAVNSDQVKEFCEGFVSQTSNFVFKPYIVGNQDPFFKEIPTRHTDRLNQLKSYWEKETERRLSEHDAAEAAAKGTQGNGESISAEHLERLINDLTSLIRTREEPNGRPQRRKSGRGKKRARRGTG